MQLGLVETKTVLDGFVDHLYETKHFVCDDIETENQYYVVREESNPKKSAVVRWKKNGYYLVETKKIGCPYGVTPKDAKQLALLDSFLSNDILVSAGLGAAGTGKTTLAMAYALKQFEDKDRRIILTKPATFIGSAKAFGPVPGTTEEKYAPFLASYQIVMSKLLGPQADYAVQQMMKKKHLQFLPLEYARGCTFENCTLILDEAQNLTWHELSSLVSRVGENSKMIILGDLNQIDVKLKRHETGLYLFLNSHTYLSSPISSTILLTEQYRSKIAALVNDTDKELRGNFE